MKGLEGLEVISMEALEFERIDIIKKDNVYCGYDECKERGNFTRCYFDTNCFCPIYDERLNSQAGE